MCFKVVSPVTFWLLGSAVSVQSYTQVLCPVLKKPGSLCGAGGLVGEIYTQIMLYCVKLTIPLILQYNGLV